MIDKYPLSDELIINCLKTHYGITVLALTNLPLGADLNASVYKAIDNAGKSYFVKLKRGHHHDVGIKVLELLHDAGFKQIIPPIKTIHAKSTQVIDGYTFVMYPFVQGKDGLSSNLSDRHWLELGIALRQVHEIEIPVITQQVVRKESYSPKSREMVRSLYSLKESEFPGDDIALKLLKFMNEHIKTIQRIVERAEKLALSIQSQSQNVVLCHSDIHGGNVLIDQNDNIFIVDWDDPIMAPKERDLMFIGGGVANVWNKEYEEKLFYKGYGSTEIDRAFLSYYRHERIVVDIAEYMQGLLFTSNGNHDRSIMYNHFIDMFAKNGVVEIAFKTDKN
jgi:spectinomycin phosphotransferase